MAYGLAVTKHVNRFINQSDPARYRQAQQAVRSARTLRRAVSTAGMLADLPAPEAEEARAVIAALPASAAEAILAAVRSALNRRLPAEIKWELGSAIEVHVTETKTRVRVTIVSPNGQRYVRAARRAKK
jgi:hypothetical protein